MDKQCEHFTLIRDVGLIIQSSINDGLGTFTQIMP